MRIYTKIVFDIETMAVLESDFFYTDGPVAFCKGDVNVPAPPPKTANELESEALNLEAQKEYLDRLRNPEKYYTENEKLISQYTTEQIKAAIEGAPAQAEYQKKMMDYTTTLVDEATQRLSQIETIKELSSYTGALSTDEKAMLDTMAQNAKDKITSAVNDETKDIIAAKISDMASRGILNSNIATDLLGRVAESAQKAIAQGTTDVETARLQQELGIQQSNKDRAMNWANYGLNQQQIFSGIAGQNFGQLQQPLQTATQSTQYASGLAQQYGSMGSTLGQNMKNIYSTERSAEANRALQASIASSQNAAGLSGSIYGALGTVAGMGAMGFMMSSKDYKENIRKMTKKEREAILKSIKGTSLYKWKYKKQFKDMKTDHMGVITEETPDFLVTDDGKRIDVVNYLGALTAAVQALEARR